MGSVNNKAVWHLGALIPFWVLQLIFIILELAFNALGLTTLIALEHYTSCHYSYYFETTTCDTYDRDLSVPIGAEGAAVGLAALFFIMTVTEIILYCMHSLTPPAYFGIELTKFIIWTIIFILSCVAIALGGAYVLAVVFTVLIWLLFMGSMIYSSVIFHRHRKGHFIGANAAHASDPAPTYQPQAVPQQQPMHQY